jgi:hypothetical protein
MVTHLAASLPWFGRVCDPTSYVKAPQKVKYKFDWQTVARTSSSITRKT